MVFVYEFVMFLIFEFLLFCIYHIALNRQFLKVIYGDTVATTFGRNCTKVPFLFEVSAEVPDHDNIIQSK